MSENTTFDDKTLLTVAAVRRSDSRACGRLITRVESGDKSVIPVLGELYRWGGRTPVIGITGPPGAGKSTLTDQLVARWRIAAKRVAVLAVDPSSPFSGGAILGDRVRMNRHYADAGVFIRSMSSRGRLGGLAAAVGDTLTILEAMQFDRIVVETVGIGQNEIDILQYAHTVVLLQTPGAGDFVQSIKAGVLEIGDIFVVNKADMPGADRTVSELQEAVILRDDPTHWCPPVLKATACTGVGIDDVIRLIDDHFSHLKQHISQWNARLRSHARARLLELVNEGLRTRAVDQSHPHSQFNRLVEAIAERRRDPHDAAKQVLARLS